MTVSEIVASRLRLMGTSQAQIAREIGTNPTQMSVFLKGEGTLSSGKLEKCLEMVGIDLAIYEHRNHMAAKIADVLESKGITQIDNLSKIDIINLTGMNQLRVLVDVKSLDEYETILYTELLDPESTFPYFKALVAYLIYIKMQMKDDFKMVLDIKERELDIKEKESDIKEKKSDIKEKESDINKIKSSIASNSLFEMLMGKLEKNKMELYRKEQELRSKEQELYNKEHELYCKIEELEQIKGEREYRKRTQKGSMFLFSKKYRESLNQKAIEYIMYGKV